jgi:hypothetical protein
MMGAQVLPWYFGLMSMSAHPTKNLSFRTDHRMPGWFSLVWTALLALTLPYVAFRSGQTMAEVVKADGADGLAFLAAGYLSAWGVFFLGGGSVVITEDRIYVRRLRDRLLRRTLEIRLEDIVDVEEVYRAALRSRVLRITTADGRHTDIQYLMLERSDVLRSALFGVGPDGESLVSD